MTSRPHAREAVLNARSPQTTATAAQCRTPARPAATTTSSEAGDRRSALRRRHQRRGRAARALRGRAAVTAPRGGGAHDVRARLRHVGQRAARGRRRCARGAGAAVSRRPRARGHRLRAPAGSRVRPHRTRSRTSSPGSMPRVRPAPRCCATSATPGRFTTGSSSSATATGMRFMGRGRCPTAPCSCPPPSATRPSAWRCSRRCSAVCAR